MTIKPRQILLDCHN